MNNNSVDLLAYIEEKRSEKAMLGCSWDSMASTLLNLVSNSVSWANNESNIEDSMDCSLALLVCNWDSMVNSWESLLRKVANVPNNLDCLVNSSAMQESRQAMLDCKRDSLENKDLSANMKQSSRGLWLDILDLSASSLGSMENTNLRANNSVKLDCSWAMLANNEDLLVNKLCSPVNSLDL